MSAVSLMGRLTIMAFLSRSAVDIGFMNFEQILIRLKIHQKNRSVRVDFGIAD